MSSEPETPAGYELSLHGTRVAVVSMSYAPEPTGIGPYSAGLAEILVEHGSEVHAIVGVPHYPSWRIEPAYRWKLRARETRNGVTVRRARHFVPSRQSAETRLLWEATFLGNAGLMGLPKLDAVVAVSPSLSSAWVGARLARRHRVPFGVLVQDLYGQSAKQAGIARSGAVVAAAAARAEGAVLRRADLVAVVSETFRGQIEDYGVPHGRVRLLPNWAHIPAPTRERQAVRHELGWDDDVFVVLHTGNMGLKQDLGNVIEAARAHEHERVLIVLMGDGNQRGALEQQGQGVRALRFMDPVPGDAYADVLRAADLLLVNEKPTVGEMALPSKLTSYLSVGQPVLAAVSADGACAHELARTGGAASVVEPGIPVVLSAAIRDLAGRRGDLVRMGVVGKTYADATLGRGAAARRVRGLAQELLGLPAR
jgi:colanic acid biosynthesis glycosyl transferase WcaI